jgi:hypothetical protein
MLEFGITEKKNGKGSKNQTRKKVNRKRELRNRK